MATSISFIGTVKLDDNYTDECPPDACQCDRNAHAQCLLTNVTIEYPCPVPI